MLLKQAPAPGYRFLAGLRQSAQAMLACVHENRRFMKD
jgi:hypothetical protein